MKAGLTGSIEEIFTDITKCIAEELSKNTANISVSAERNARALPIDG